ncbi:hypothetical protein C2I17_21745 [Niallia circulans]|nr:hypothetical protein C2I17_21745 [Niallia circulans]
MENRINGSYLYFLIDDNLIYCYKLESHTYITLDDLKKLSILLFIILKIDKSFKALNMKIVKQCKVLDYFWMKKV